MINLKKSEVYILHLYHDLMNLYGDWANVAVLTRLINVRGIKVYADRMSIGDRIDFDKYEFIYIGSGTERSQRACMRDLARYAPVFVEKIEAGTHVLATGNSHELFGRAITDADGERYEALGLLDFETVQLDTRVTGDCVCKMAAPELAEALPERFVGFINRAGHGQVELGEVPRAFAVEFGPGASDEVLMDKMSINKNPCEEDTPVCNGDQPPAPGARLEGIVHKNLLGTYMTGPILVRNPALLRFYADRLCPGPYDTGICRDPFFDYQERAYSIALNGLTARVED